MKLIDMAEQILSTSKGALHVDDIALKITEQFPNIPIPLDSLPAKLSNVLSRETRQKNSRFSKPKNKQGGSKKGMYRLKRTIVKDPIPATEQPKVGSQFTGRAGEYAVLSELLYWGYNASIMAVDDGIDVVASKDNTYSHIQVKTANKNQSGNYIYNIKNERFIYKHSRSTCYILVLRREKDNRYFNDFIILPSIEIKRLIDCNTIKEKENLSLTISIDDFGHFKLNNSEQVNTRVNCWNSILRNIPKSNTNPAGRPAGSSP